RAPRLTAAHRLALWLWALATVGLIALASHGTAFATDADVLAGRPLLAALKAGGLILYFRHTSTGFGQNDEQMTGFEDCARQRNLTNPGRDEARAIGPATERLALPVGPLPASPFPRTT